MKFVKGDYLVVKEEGKSKNRLVKVISEDGHTLTVRNEGSKVKHDRETFEVKIEQVVVNLGQEPQYGKVYGVDVEPYVSSTDCDWGPLHYYRRLDEEQKKKLKKALNKCYTILDKAKLTGFLPIVIEVRNPKGSMVGHYSQFTKDDLPDILCVKPHSFDKQDDFHSNLDFIIYHEAGHGLDLNLVVPEIKVKWVKLYTYYTKLKELTGKELDKIRREIESAGDFNCGVDKDHLDACITAIHNNYGLRKQELKLMLEHGQSFEEIWPSHALDLADCEEPMRTYSQKNVDEFLADSFAYYMVGKKLPKRINRLVEETISACRGKTP